MSKRTFRRIFGWGMAFFLAAAIVFDKSEGALRTVAGVVFILTAFIVVAAGFYMAYTGRDKKDKQ